MTLTHESGHLLLGWFCGGTLQFVELWPWPQSLFVPDPYPLGTLWGGPILGAAIPIAAAGLFRKEWLWFVAHFCLLANGLYLAGSWYTGDRFLDSPRLLKAGAHPLSLLAYCLVTIPWGYLGLRRSLVQVLHSPRTHASP